jgi:endonuclease YncB( thermonuclease family)
MRRFASIACLFALTGCFGGNLEDGIYEVRRVLSGDTVELRSGKTVRYAGIRAPVLGEPFFEEARIVNDRYVVGREVKVNFKFLEGVEDAKGHPCAMVLVPARALKVSVLVNTELLERGLARIDFKTLPRGRERFFEEREERARQDRRGIWSRR